MTQEEQFEQIKKWCNKWAVTLSNDLDKTQDYFKAMQNKVSMLKYPEEIKNELICIYNLTMAAYYEYNRGNFSIDRAKDQINLMKIKYFDIK